MAGVSLSGKTVLIDPGFDRYVDPVAASAPAESIDGVSFDVATRLAERLRDVGAAVHLTRGHGEAPLAAPDRAALAESVSADLVISLLTETHSSSQASGVSTYYWGGGRVGQHSETGHQLATLIQREIVARTDVVDCRSHPTSYDLVRLTRMPAVIVSTGYLSNPDDVRRLNDSDFRAVLAEAVLFAVQRLYLAEDDAATGTLNLNDVRAFAQQR
jgi:N-acetylmuramoyl-L-alanine amidase